MRQEGLGGSKEGQRRDQRRGKGGANAKGKVGEHQEDGEGRVASKGFHQ